MKIYIPTRGRAPSAQHTYRALEESGTKYPFTLLVATEEEAEVFRNCEMEVEVSNAGPGIAAARDYVLSTAPDKVIMLDDDLNGWAERLPGEPVRFARSVDAPDKALKTIDALLEKFTHAAIGHRQGANRRPVYEANTRMLRALAYRADIVRSLGIRPTLPLMQDFEMTLKLLTAGHQNIVYNGVVQDQPASNSAGGCSEFRTAELMAMCAGKLKDMFPDFVSLKQSDGWDIGIRTDVTIYWKKAYESSKS